MALSESPIQETYCEKNINYFLGGIPSICLFLFKHINVTLNYSMKYLALIWMIIYESEFRGIIAKGRQILMDGDMPLKYDFLN